MEKKILKYRNHMDRLLDGDRECDWAETARQHLVQIGFFQHERMVHLIVTVTFALLEIMAAVLAAVAFTPFTGALAVLLLVLLVPYIRHYYVLENEVQKMYEQYDRIKEREAAAAG